MLARSTYTFLAIVFQILALSFMSPSAYGAEDDDRIVVPAPSDPMPGERDPTPGHGGGSGGGGSGGAGDPNYTGPIGGNAWQNLSVSCSDPQEIRNLAIQPLEIGRTASGRSLPIDYWGRSPKLHVQRPIWTFGRTILSNQRMPLGTIEHLCLNSWREGTSV